MKRIWAVLTIFGAVLTLAIPMRTVQAQDGGTAAFSHEPENLPELAAQFMQWALSIPNDANPQVDQTGAFCMVGQRGPVWFLAGTLGSVAPNQTITRDCTVPEGVTIFFPVINGFAFNTPGCGQDTDLKTVEALKKFYFDTLTGFINKAFDVSATLDGRSIKVRRFESVPFAVAYPPGGIFGPDACGTGVPLAPGIYSPGITDGYWVAIPNLKASLTPYTIHFHAQSGETIQDVTYNITVTRVRLK
jgi:hypothetical protein